MLKSGFQGMITMKNQPIVNAPGKYEIRVAVQVRPNDSKEIRS